MYICYIKHGFTLCVNRKLESFGEVPLGIMCKALLPRTVGGDIPFVIVYLGRISNVNFILPQKQENLNDNEVRAHKVIFFFSQKNGGKKIQRRLDKCSNFIQLILNINFLNNP